MYIVLIAVVAIIALLVTLCATLTPNPIWGPRALKDSPVDISLIERLDGHTEYFGQEGMEAWMEAVDQRGEPLREMSGNPSWNPNKSGHMGTYSFRYSGVSYEGFTRSGGTVQFLIHDTAGNAEGRLLRERERELFLTSRQKHIVISDDVEATLGSVMWSRETYPPFFYANEKRMETQIRVNNIFLRFHEVTDLDFAGVATNLALEQIVEALESLNLQED